MFVYRVKKNIIKVLCFFSMVSCLHATTDYPKIEDLAIDDLSPGIYQSNDIAKILSYPMTYCEQNDLIIFDIDQVIITERANPYTLTPDFETSNYKELQGKGKIYKDKFLLYLYASESPANIALMDDRIPLYIESLQHKKITCMANTALDSVLGTDHNIDIAGARVNLLKNLGINFDQNFAEVLDWDFENMNPELIKNSPPLVHKGIIFSSLVPKHSTQIAFLKHFSFTPRKIIYIDDNIKHLEEMYRHMSHLRIPCYCFQYTRKHSKKLKEYFNYRTLADEKNTLDPFIDALLNDEDLSDYFRSSYNANFINNLRFSFGWRIWI